MSLGRAIKGIKKAGTLLVSPRMEAFLRAYPDGARWDDDTYALIREITEAWKANDDRSGRFGASSRGTCHRRQVFGFLGMHTYEVMSPEKQNLFNDGKWRHMRWQVLGVESGALTHVEYPYGSKTWRVSGRMDGLNSYEAFGFEAKGDRRMVRTLDALPEDHMLQVHTMMLATGWDTFSYLIEDKSTNDWREVVVRRDKRLIVEVKKELQILNEHVEDRILPEVLPACAKKEGPYRTCPFAKQCLKRHQQGDHWPADRDWND